MNKIMELWEKSGLLNHLNDSKKVACTSKMEAMKNFLLSPGYEKMIKQVKSITVNPAMVMFPIVRRLFDKGQEFDSANLVKNFLDFCEENQFKAKYAAAEDPELELTFDFCDEYAV